MNESNVTVIEADETPNLPATRPKMEVASPMDMGTAEFAAALDRRKANRKVLIDWVREALVDGVDFGSVKTKRGASKPSLRKPGAEKICGMLNVTATYPTLNDYEKAALAGVKIESIILRCELLSSSGAVLAHGVGARALAADEGDLNKALKMAKKSAMIDATLQMAGLSEIFTQDLEDKPPQQQMNLEPGRTTPASPSAPPKPAAPWSLKRFEAYCLARLAQVAKSNWAWWKYAVDRGWILPTETIDALVVEGHKCGDNIFGLNEKAKPEENRDAAAKAFKVHETAVGAMINAIGAEEADLAQKAFQLVSAGAAQQNASTPPPAAAQSPAPTPAPAAPKPAPAPAGGNPYACPGCRSTATKKSEEYEAVMWCQKCGHQWDSAGKPFEAHPWMFTMCPIPPKGTKKADYKPVTLGQIARTESNRFYGLVMNNSEEKARAGWEYKGKHYDSKPEDIVFGAACDQARAYMDSQKEQKEDEPEPPEDDIPF